MQFKIVFYKAYFCVLWINTTQLVSTWDGLKGKDTMQKNNQMLLFEDISLSKCHKLKSRLEHFYTDLCTGDKRELMWGYLSP